MTMNRREAIAHLTAAALTASASPAARPAPAAADAVMERLLLTAVDLREALDQFVHLHDLADADRCCGCHACEDAAGLAYLLGGPFQMLRDQFRSTERLRRREQEYKAACAARDNERRRRA